MGTALIVPAEEGVLANDGEAPGPRRVEVMETTRHGELSSSPDGAFRHIPNANREGPDAFRYRIRSGGEFSNTATVEIAVGVCRGFVWNRSDEWTPGTVVGASDGNPDDDSLGQPVWF